jgi:hypothetical protein
MRLRSDTGLTLQPASAHWWLADHQDTLQGKLTGLSELGGLEKSADPSAPAEGEFTIWMSDGTGKGDDGDILIAVTAGGATKWKTLFDFDSEGSSW